MSKISIPKVKIYRKHKISNNSVSVWNWGVWGVLNSISSVSVLLGKSKKYEVLFAFPKLCSNIRVLIYCSNKYPSSNPKFKGVYPVSNPPVTLLPTQGYSHWNYLVSRYPTSSPFYCYFVKGHKKNRWQK